MVNLGELERRNALTGPKIVLLLRPLLLLLLCVLFVSNPRVVLRDPKAFEFGGGGGSTSSAGESGKMLEGRIEY